MMPSNELLKWKTERNKELNEIVAAHRSVGGVKRGRRFATQQINHAYAMLLSSQFQGFCRDLHSEAADFLAAVVPASLRDVITSEFRYGRKLDSGNPNPGNIGADFNRFGFVLWTQLIQQDSLNSARKDELEELNLWRNAIAHQNFDPAKLGRPRLRLAMVQRWKRVCDELAVEMDELLRSHLAGFTGRVPW